VSGRIILVNMSYKCVLRDQANDKAKNHELFNAHTHEKSATREGLRGRTE